jgi:tripartite-type tricarboxylate transporter receptor subunit TctC
MCEKEKIRRDGVMRRMYSFFAIFLTISILCLGFAGKCNSADKYADWPKKNITIVCHTGAGAVDTMMRQLAAQLEPILGVSIIIENRAGGDGAVAMSYVLNQPKDGYTFMSATGSFTFAFSNGEINFTPDDFNWITTLNGEPTAVAVLKESPYKTLDDFVKDIKADPNRVVVGGYGSAAFNQFILFELEQKTGFHTTWIPFASGGDAPINLLGKHINVSFMTPSSGVNQVTGGDIRLLAISSSNRSKYFPDVPTFQEAGYDIADILWRGIICAKDVPQEIVDKMLVAIKKAKATKGWQDYLDKNLQDSVDISGNDFYKKVVDEVAARKKFLDSLDG